jgi:hypothetical protein
MKRRRGKAQPKGLVRRGKAGGPQIVRNGPGSWTDAHEARFLDELAAHCTVKRAAAAVGFSTEAVYRRRNVDPVFAEKWRAALTQGYLQIEMGLIRRANEALGDSAGARPEPANPVVPMTVKEALSLLKLHQLTVTGAGKAYGKRARVRSSDEVRDSILVKLEAIASVRGLAIAVREGLGKRDGGDAGEGAGAGG